jgi:nucleotidyltransferase substrate binding protein (TIGR01987 family)
MSAKDIRWKQRLSNFKRAFAKLDLAIQKVKSDYQWDAKGTINEDSFLDDIIKEGIIQRFEYTHELAWNVMKDFLSEVGEVKIFGSKDASKEAFAAGLISEGEVWMDMIKSRNKTSHTYNEETADEIFFKIIHDYHPAFQAFQIKMEQM